MLTRHCFSALVPAALLSLASPGFSQDTDEAAWFAFGGVGRVDNFGSGRVRWWFDAHARFFDESNGFETSIIRPGLGYDLTENSTAWLGYAWIRNDPIPGGFNEHRIWQQFTWGRPYDWGTPLLRTRFEQRFDDRGSDVGLRLRQFARWTRPVTSGSQLGWRVWDEVFIDLNDTTWGQDTGVSQNRAFAGLGWSFDSRFTLEFGYLNQHVLRESAEDSSNHVLALTLLGSF